MGRREITAAADGVARDGAGLRARQEGYGGDASGVCDRPQYEHPQRQRVSTGNGGVSGRRGPGAAVEPAKLVDRNFSQRCFRENIPWIGI